MCISIIFITSHGAARPSVYHVSTPPSFKNIRPFKPTTICVSNSRLCLNNCQSCCLKFVQKCVSPKLSPRVGGASAISPPRYGGNGCFKVDTVTSCCSAGLLTVKEAQEQAVHPFCEPVLSAGLQKPDLAMGTDVH